MSQPYKIDNFIPTLHQQDHFYGSNDAPIIVVEYGDYQCPKSCQVYTLIKQLQAQCGDRILFVFRHFPQPHRHSQAQKAAEIAEAAAAQNQFWAMHELLCQSAETLADSDLVEYAVQLNLDIPRVLQELADHVHRDRVQGDIHSVQQQGIDQAPACFVSIRCQPNQDLKCLLLAILQALTA